MLLLLVNVTADCRKSGLGDGDSVVFILPIKRLKDELVLVYPMG